MSRQGSLKVKKLVSFFHHPLALCPDPHTSKHVAYPRFVQIILNPLQIAQSAGLKAKLWKTHLEWYGLASEPLEPNHVTPGANHRHILWSTSLLYMCFTMFQVLSQFSLPWAILQSGQNFLLMYATSKTVEYGVRNLRLDVNICDWLIWIFTFTLQKLNAVVHVGWDISHQPPS